MQTDLPSPTLDGEATPRLSPFATVASAPTKETPGEDLLSLPAIPLGNRAIDLTGKRLGRLLALKPVARDAHNRLFWLLLCDCGKHVIKKAAYLHCGDTLSCGCLSQEIRIARSTANIAGAVFGRLTAIAPTALRRQGCVVWECRCECGNTTHALVPYLRNGGTRSCGCLHDETSRQTLVALHASGRFAGEKSPNYNPELSEADRENQRCRPEMLERRAQTMVRDGYDCVVCGQHGGALVVHHMEPWSQSKELRHDRDNLITMCKKCHKSYHKKFPAKSANTENFIIWVRHEKEKLKKK